MDGNPVSHVHFMGICGSGCASIAMLAYAAGFQVSGCDTSTESYYAGELRKLGIRIFQGHDASHLSDDVDIVAVSPAIFDVNPDNPELLLAKEKGILMTWQEFMGRYLQQGKRLLAIAGTHGKTTTTFLSAEMLIDAGLDPTVEGGSVFRKWGNGGRPGNSDLFICEADEFNHNFYHYHPEIAVINNVEMDHPECFRDLEDMISAYVNYLQADDCLKTVVLNGDSSGAVEVMRRITEGKTPDSVDYLVFSDDPEAAVFTEFPAVTPVIYQITEKTPEGTGFTVIKDGEAHPFHMALYGDYNGANAVSAILAAWKLGVSDDSIEKTLMNFKGVGRRFDQVGTLKNVPVFDDYAHHPTEIHAVLSMCRDYFSDKKILAVFEPHQVSRLRMMFDRYLQALLIADQVVIMKTHLGREVHKDVHPISREEWEGASPKIHYEEDPERIKEFAAREIDAGNCDLIVVIGAANSYKISRLLCESAEL